MLPALRGALGRVLVRRGFTLRPRRGEVEVEVHWPPRFPARNVHVEFNR